MPALGCETLVLLSALGEEPTKHVDLFLQFLSPTEVAVAQLDPEVEPDDARRLEEAAAAVRELGVARGRPLRVVRPPMGVDPAGDLHPYLNGLRLGGAFLMPVYGRRPPPLERRARGVLQDAVPGLAVVRIPAAQMVDLGGAIHCAALGLGLPGGGATEGT